MHQEKDKQIVPFDYMTLKKNVICNFCLAKCIRKGQKICFCWLHEEWLSPQKEQFLFLSERHLSRKERHLYFLRHLSHLYFLTCQMHQKRKTKLFLLTTWRMALTTKRATFGSILNVMFLKMNVICTFCLAKCIRKGQKKIKNPYDYMKNGSLHKKIILLYLSERHLSRK